MPVEVEDVVLDPFGLCSYADVVAIRRAEPDELVLDLSDMQVSRSMNGTSDPAIIVQLKRERTIEDGGV